MHDQGAITGLQIGSRKSHSCWLRVVSKRLCLVCRCKSGSCKAGGGSELVVSRGRKNELALCAVQKMLQMFRQHFGRDQQDPDSSKSRGKHHNHIGKTVVRQYRDGVTFVQGIGIGQVPGLLPEGRMELFVGKDFGRTSIGTWVVNLDAGFAAVEISVLLEQVSQNYHKCAIRNQVRKNATRINA